MPNLTKASRELFKRQPDECFPSLTVSWEHCQRQKEACVDRITHFELRQPTPASCSQSGHQL